MVKKKKEMTEKKLTAAQYWEWRTTIEELKSAKLSDEVTKLKRDAMEREIENKKLRLALFKDVLRASAHQSKKAKDEYDRYKKVLEGELEMALDGCVISDVDFSVQKLD